LFTPVPTISIERFIIFLSANANIYDVLETIFADFSDLFPADTVHLGADEVVFDCWRSSQEVRDFMQENGWNPDSDDDMFAMWVDFELKVRQRLNAANEGKSPKKALVWTSSLTERGKKRVRTEGAPF